MKIGTSDVSKLYVGSAEVDKVYLGTDLVYGGGGGHDYSQDYLTFVALENGTFKFSGNSINYSVDDGQTWTTLASNTDTPTVTVGNKILWKTSGLTPSSTSGIGKFISSGQFDVEGNIMSLVSGDSFVSATTLASNQFRILFDGNNKLINAEHLILPVTSLAYRCYNFMFNGCTSLTTAPVLPATTLADECYAYMFQTCKNLIAAPALPATTLASGCYYGMFKGCTSLTTAPSVLPATTLTQSCYSEMFNGCTSLTTAPSVLPATTLTQSCYEGMFRGCSGLTTAPELPATTLNSKCYYGMFRGCRSLTTTPELPATTLAPYCYADMFYDCTSLTTAPELPATTLANISYTQMFRACRNLNSITCLATDISASNCTGDWLNSVAATGTFTKAASMTSWPTGSSGIPNGWTVQDFQE